MVSRPRNVSVLRWGIAVIFAAAAPGCGQEPAADAEPPRSGLTAEELAAEPPAYEEENPRPRPAQPVSAAEAVDVRIEVLAEAGYHDERGRYVIDLLERDYAYLAVQLETGNGRPVEGAAPAFSIEGTSQLLEPAEVSPRSTSDERGMVEFAVVGGEMGLDRITVEFGGASTEIMVNLISLRAAGFPAPPAVEGGLPWEELMQARIRYEDWVLVAEFPTAISEHAGRTVKLSGFMMPLEPELKQRRFLLTSNPPSCFFHVPGGPAGAVEVFADEGIEVSWDPVVVEGRFEPQQKSEVGVVYRLYDARLVSP